jgi:hypothetical protein
MASHDHPNHNEPTISPYQPPIRHHPLTSTTISHIVPSISHFQPRRSSTNHHEAPKIEYKGLGGSLDPQHVQFCLAF